jgi:DNA-binding beta-propeller fold protein YncE
MELLLGRQPAGLALSVDGQSLYVADLAASPNGAIIRLAAGTGAVQDRLSSRDLPFSLTLDSDSIYWTERGSGAVFKAPLVLGGSTATLLATGQAQPYGIALDTQNVYWANEGTNNILRVSKAGGSRTEIAGSQGTPHGLVVDNSLVYWANSTEGTIRAAPPGAGTISLVASVAMPEALVIYQNEVYATTASTVSRVTGTSRRDIVTGQTRPIGLAFDNGFVYWTNRGTAPDYTDGSVMRMSLSGSGTPEVLARGDTWAKSPWSIVVDAGYVYWTTFTPNGSVWQLPK